VYDRPMRQLSIIAVLVIAAVSACGDNSSNNRPDASARPDARQGADASDVDAPIGTPDAAVDANTALPDAMISGVSAQIATAKATADGTGLALPITGAIVTYLKPQIGSLTNDPAGFTIQGEQAGPALFVSVDPATLTPAPAIGDTVDFTIDTMGTVGMQRRAQVITGYARTATGADVGALAQNVGAATDLVTAVDSYDSEVIDVTGTIAGPFAASGAGFQRAAIDTAGITGDTNFQLRVPTTLRDGLDIEMGCTFTLNDTPVGRFNAQTQLAAFTNGDIALSGCPAPTVVSAAALSSTSVRITFTRNINAGSVVGDGSQFTFDNGLTASAASVSGRTVTVTTNAQASVTYTVTVAGTVTDLQGTAVGTPNTATFSGFVTPAVVRINELNANITGGCDLIELRVVSAGSMDNFKIQERTGSASANELAMSFTGLTVAKNDLVVVHLNSANATCNPGGASQETTGPAQQPLATFGGNYDTAYDWWDLDTGLTSTDNVITLYDGAGAIMDAVFVSDDPTGTAAANTETQAADVAAANQWQIVGGGVPPGGFIDDDFSANAALDLNDPTSTTAAGTSIQRLDNTDDNDKDDWNTAVVTVQAQTWGLINLGQTPF